MQDDELKKIWSSASANEAVSFDRSALITELNAEVKNLEAVVRKRDRREIVAAAQVAIIFTLFLFFTHVFLKQLGFIIIILSSFWIAYVIKKSKTKAHEDFSLPVKEQLNRQKKFLVGQKKLLGSVLWWYISPFTAGFILVTLGGNHSLAVSSLMLGVAAAISIGIYYLNRQAVKKQIEPLIRKVETVLKELEQ